MQHGRLSTPTHREHVEMPQGSHCRTATQDMQYDCRRQPHYHRHIQLSSALTHIQWRNTAGWVRSLTYFFACAAESNESVVVTRATEQTVATVTTRHCPIWYPVHSVHTVFTHYPSAPSAGRPAPMRNDVPCMIGQLLKW